MFCCVFVELRLGFRMLMMTGISVSGEFGGRFVSLCVCVFCCVYVVI